MASFSDDFNRADTSDLGAGWVEVSGDWSIVSNQLSPGSAGGTIILRAATAMDTSDHYAQITIAATAAVSQGVWCRGNSNISSGYLWRNNGTSWDLFSVIGGSFTVIGTYTAAAAPGDVAKVQAVGSTIKGFVNGVQRASVTDTGVTTGTSVGIRGESSGSLRYDDFSAGDVTAGATLGAASAVDTGQALARSKTTALGAATGTETAQPVTGAKTASLTLAASSEAAQQLAGSKAAALTVAAQTETAQPLTATKIAALGGVNAVDAAQPLTAAVSRSLGPAASVGNAQPLAGVKAAVLGPAVETSTARPLVPAGAGDDVDITVGEPYSPWAVGVPQSVRWEVATPW
ncbi:hypothetical protein [Streptomyces sp. NPDC005303]|uniref:hypothetical protein n=1 Tax=Streptomyces sp. NPDC005303 TaxID=3155713 RepID=UPI0033BDDA36